MLYPSWLMVVALLSAAVLFSNRAAFIVALSYFLNCAILYLFMKEIDGFTIYAVCSIVPLLLMKWCQDSFYAAIALFLFSMFHLVASADYLYYSFHSENVTIFYQYYYEIFAFLDIGMIALCLKGVDNDNGNTIKNPSYYRYSVEGLQCTTQHIQTLENGKRWK